MNLIRPYRIMNELYQETNLILKKHINNYQRMPTAFVGTWWAIWVIGNIINNILSRTSNSAETTEEFISMTQFSIATGVIDLSACLLAIKVVKDYVLMEEKLWAVETDGKVSRFNNTSEYDDILDVPID